MANNIIKRIWNQNKMVQIEDLKGMAFQAEDGGHTFEIYGIDEAGETVSLTGTPSGVFLRPDNTDVVLSCSVSGGVVSATLPDECYAVPGRGGLTVFITADGKKTALYAAVVTVSRTSSGNVAPPATQTVVDLVNAISAAVATIPASYSALMADIAPTYSTSALYAVGQYAWYDGDLKRCIVPITTAESYTAAHWTSAVLGNDVSDLKSALSSIEKPLTYNLNDNGGIKYDTGEVQASNSNKYTNYVDITGYDYIHYTRICATSSNSAYGIAFFNSSKVYISGVQNINNAAQLAYQMNFVSVPANAKYIRATVSAGLSTDLFVLNGLHDLSSFDPDEIENTIDNDTMIRKTVLDSSNNMNSVLNMGVYKVAGGSLPTNYPASSGGTVIVAAYTGTGENGYKVHFVVNTSGIYYRVQASNEWKDWVFFPVPSKSEYAVKIRPGFGMNGTTGLPGTGFHGEGLYAADKLIKVPYDGKIEIKSSVGCIIERYSIYDADYSLVSVVTTHVSLTSNTYQTMNITTGKYICPVFRKNAEEYVDFYPVITVCGLFEGEPFRFLPRMNSGNINLSVPVRIYNDDLSSGLGDDYGVLMLPESYSSEGEPTRLIIYCHGSGTHYTPGTNQFTDGSPLDPTFFLSEGYAVMDIDGNPFDNTHPSFYIPESLPCYIAAYNYVTERFNIKRDGVILGGRSMGGSMCIEILQSGEIPVIACFPVAMAYNFANYFNHIHVASDREFLATNYGLPDADSITWTTDDPMTDDEWNYLKANFRTLLQNVPAWKYLEADLDASELMNNNFNVVSSTTNIPAEAALYEGFRARIRIPVKMYYAKDDTTCPYKRNTMYLYNQLLNTGSRVYIKGYNSGGHRFEVDEANLVASYTNSKGVTLTDVPSVYIDALNFFRQYEQSN